MEKKTTQRIIGILVIAALVIILLPLLFSGQESTTDTAALNPPPFPVAQNDVASTPQVPTNPATPNEVNAQANSGTLTPPPSADQSTPNPDAQTADLQTQQPETNDNLQSPATATQANNNNTTLPEATVQQPAATPDTAPLAQNPQQPEAQAPAQQEPQKLATAKPNTQTKPTTNASNPATTEQKPFDPQSFDIQGDQQAQNQTDALNNTEAGLAPIAQAPQLASNMESVAATPAAAIAPVAKPHATHTTPAKRKTAQFTNAAWVVQMGSFKSKSNAEHLANHLRAMGYKAFMQQSKSAQGEPRTQVFVGPEFKKVAASGLANKIDHDTSMRGFVVSYKPLEL